MILGLLVLIAILTGKREEESPFSATPDSGLPDFTVRKTRDLPAGGWEAELVVSNDAIREDVIRLGNWLLEKSPSDKVLMAGIYNSREKLAVVSRFGGEEEVTWLPDLPPRPTPDMPFDELKKFAMSLEYDELYRHFDKYSSATWQRTGGPPPLLYFVGEIIQTEDLGGILAEIWSAQLALHDNNPIVFNYKEPTLMVGDSVEFIGVCDNLRSFRMVGGGTRTMPFCRAWQVRLISSD